MKIFKIFTPLLLLTSCSSKITDRRFVTINPHKEWEVTLTLNKDSNFILKDNFCCNKFYYCGKWQYATSKTKDKIILSDTIKAQFENFHGAYRVYNRETNSVELYLPANYFPVISNDTITITKNGSEILFRDLKFERQTIFNRKNLSKTRALLIAHDLVDWVDMSNKEFKSQFGKSKRQIIKEKTKEFMICHPVPIPMNMHPVDPHQYHDIIKNM